jgi:hypothetical protein
VKHSDDEEADENIGGSPTIGSNQKDAGEKGRSSVSAPDPNEGGGGARGAISKSGAALSSSKGQDFSPVAGATAGRGNDDAGKRADSRRDSGDGQVSSFSSLDSKDKVKFDSTEASVVVPPRVEDLAGQSAKSLLGTSKPVNPAAKTKKVERTGGIPKKDEE